MARVLLSEQIADQIKKMTETRFGPGDRIPPELELSETLGVSRTTVREAVKILCSQNILEIRRGNGTFVCENPGLASDPLNSKDLDADQLKADIFEISIIMEPELIRLAAEKSKPELVEAAAALHQEFLDKLAIYKNGEYVSANEFRRLDVEFHKAIIDCCQNQIVSRSVPIFIALCDEWYNVWTTLDIDRVLAGFEKYHQLILDAVADHRSSDAYKYSLEHTQEIIDLYMGRV